MLPKARIATVSTKTASIGMAFLVHGWAGPRPSGLPAAAPTASPSAAPATSPSAAPPATAAHQPDNQQEYQRADGGVDDRRDKARADVDAELRKQPAPDQGAYDADNEVADEPKPVPCTIWPASHPAMRPTTSMVRRLSPDMASSLGSRMNSESSDHGANGQGGLCKFEHSTKGKFKPRHPSSRVRPPSKEKAPEGAQS